MNSKIKLLAGIAVYSLFISGCTMQPAEIEYRDVMAPTPTLPELPQQLHTPEVVALPVFVNAGHPDAVAGITLEQTVVFKHWVNSLKAQLAGFRALFNGDDVDVLRPP